MVKEAKGRDGMERVKIKPNVNGLIPRLKAYQQLEREGVVVGKYDVGYGELWAVRFIGKGNIGLLANIDYFQKDNLLITNGPREAAPAEVGNGNSNQKTSSASADESP